LRGLKELQFLEISRSDGRSIQKKYHGPDMQSPIKKECFERWIASATISIRITPIGKDKPAGPDKNIPYWKKQDIM
jgi:hypothetical protein